MPRFNPQNAVRVRMYRQGIGDCFLLTLPGTDKKNVHVLVDCGVLVGTKNAKEWMVRVAEDIRATTGGRLDVVIATHEHWDHLSGFMQARDVFDRMSFGEVWLAWTEDPHDALAQELRRQRHQALQGLRAIAGRAREADWDARTEKMRLQQQRGLQGAPADSAGETEEDAHNRLVGTLGFFGARSGPTTRDALDYLVEHPSHPVVRYHRPGGVPIAVGSAQTYILGPPYDSTALRRSNPTKAGREVYDLSEAMALLPTAASLSGDDDGEDDRSHAFDPRYRVTVDAAGMNAFYQTNYFQKTDRWRRIDEVWQASGEQLALALDNHTNNTSLALAFELEPDGRVLLFPGDAQVGNWLSWDAYRWPAAADRAKRVTIADLLQRTVFYKVGHHGSHNATLRDKGLERMLSPDLVAMIPVDAELAERKRWNMPFESLLQRLQALTRGRVLRADKPIPGRPGNVSEAVWQGFRDRLEEDERYFDLYFPNP